jgi:hypothetical protein
LSDSTIRSAFNALKAILDAAIRDEALARNVATAVTRPKVARRRLLTSSQRTSGGFWGLPRQADTRPGSRSWSTLG